MAFVTRISEAMAGGKTVSEAVGHLESLCKNQTLPAFHKSLQTPKAKKAMLTNPAGQSAS
jgi:hypothetical protein